jgi:hypothetical protein
MRAVMNKLMIVACFTAACSKGTIRTSAGDCTGPDGAIIRNGASAQYSATASVPFGQTCSAETRACTNGTLSGTYMAAACFVQDPADCTGPDDAAISNGTGRTYYESATVPYGQACLSEIRECTDGLLSGTYQAPSCAPLAPADCVGPDGSAIAHGTSRAYYQSAAVTYPQACAAENRLCTNGTLYGSFLYPACGVQCAPAFATGAPRGGETVVFARDTYEYVPSVLDDGVYRMWWCGGIAGDYILYAEASALAGPWHSRSSTTPGTYDIVFQPTGGGTDFDGLHTCDPSVIRVNGTYYLYYGGGPQPTAAEQTTKIGVATSPDGFTWTRLNNGNPIIVPARPDATYGAGQPSVTFLDGKLYIIFTDTTGRGGNQGNGAGQYVMRSADPTFQTDVEELAAEGFVAYNPATHTGFSLNEAYSVDWQFVDALDAFAVAVSRGDGATSAIEVAFYDRGLTTYLGSVSLPGSWHDGPGIVSRPDRHAVPSSACGVVPLDVVRAVGPGGPSTWDLAWVGADLVTGLACDCIPWGNVYEGCLVVSAGLPLTLIRGGVRLQLALAAPGNRLSKSVYAVPSSVFYAVPYGASLSAGSAAYMAAGRPGAFLLDGPSGANSLWAVSCPEVVSDNGSIMTGISTAEWDAYPRGPDLFCVQP